MFVRAKKSGPYQYLQVKVISLYEKERQTRLTQPKKSFERGWQEC
jgi:hypothetical protein